MCLEKLPCKDPQFNTTATTHHWVHIETHTLPNTPFIVDIRSLKAMPYKVKSSQTVTTGYTLLWKYAPFFVYSKIAKQY